MWEDTRWPASLRASNSSARRMRWRGRKKSRFVSGMKPLIRGSNVCGRFFGDWLILPVRSGWNSGFGTRAVVFVESSTVGMFASFLNFSSVWPKIFEFRFGNPWFQSLAQKLLGSLPQRKREEKITTNQKPVKTALKKSDQGRVFAISAGGFGKVCKRAKTNRAKRPPFCSMRLPVFPKNLTSPIFLNPFRSAANRVSLL